MLKRTSSAGNSQQASGAALPRKRFLVIKRNLLRGRYPRILELGPQGVKSLDPTRGLEVTNDWTWEQVLGCEAEADGISLSVQSKGGIFSSSGVDKIYFEGDTAGVIGAILVESAHYSGRNRSWPRIEGHKLSFWKKSIRPVDLLITPESIQVLNKSSGTLMSEYYLSTISKIGVCADGLFVELRGDRTHVFQITRNKEAIDAIQRAAGALRLRLNRSDLLKSGANELVQESAGGTSSSAFLTKPHEPGWFSVSCEKISAKHSTPVRRRLVLFHSPSMLQEFEESDGVIGKCTSLRTVTSIEAITCPSDQPTVIQLHFKDLKTVQYTTVSRDDLACCLLDILALESLSTVPLYTSTSSTKFRMIPRELETLEARDVSFQSLLSSLRLLNSERSDSSALVRAFAEFNVNSSLDMFTEQSPPSQERLEMITVATAFANELLERPKVPMRALNEVVQTLVRVSRFSSIAISKSELMKLGLVCMKKGDVFVVRSWFQVLHTLCSSMHQERGVAYSNRHALVSLELVQAIGKVVYAGLNHETSMGLTRGSVTLTSAITYVFEPLMVTERECTPPEVYDALMEIFLATPRTTIKLLEHCRTLPNYSQQVALLFTRLFEPLREEDGEGDMLQAQSTKFDRLEREALTSGYFLYMFRQAIFAEFRIKRATSRVFLAMFCSTSKDTLHQLVPPGLVHVLDVPQLDSVALKAMMEDDAMDDMDFRQRLQRVERVQRCGVVPRKAALERKRHKRNFPVFFHMIQRDHSLPDLIWNEATRNDLKLSLDRELAEVTFSDKYAWNYIEFQVEYPSLSKEILLGDCYVRLLLDEDEQSACKLVKQIREPQRFFHSLFHHLLRAITDEQRIDCLRALYLVQTVHNLTFGGEGFSESHTIAELAVTTMNRAVSDHAFLLMQALAEDKSSLKLLLKSPLAIEAALFNISRVHSAAAVEDPGAIKEWYMNQSESEGRQGPFSIAELKSVIGTFSSSSVSAARFWASGMQKEWKAAMDIPQLKYQLLMCGRSIIDEEAIALASLRVLTLFVKASPSIDDEGRWVRPPPKAYRILTRKENITRIANAMLAHFAPRVVDAAAGLLALLGQVPELTRKLYLTGVFYFALGYRGSNFENISQLLFTTHLEQHFSEEATNASGSLKHRSVLAEMLPEAMLNVLLKSSAAFTAAFVGADLDTPELIWTGEMRRALIEAIDFHLQGFAGKLQENFNARFDFVPIPPVTYKRLEKETFCYRYYLDNLCNRDRFPDWPISDAVALLKAALDLWRRESDQCRGQQTNAQGSKSTSVFVTKADALRALELYDDSTKSEDVSLEDIKKAWRKLARQFHPDRNPAGRERFELVQAAYDQLVAPRAEYHFRNTADPVTLASILECQVLVMEKHAATLEAFRYAGFDLILNLLDMYIDPSTAEKLQQDPYQLKLLETACKLLFRVCWVSHHNADELEKHVPRLARMTLRFRSSPPYPLSCYTNLLRVIAGLAALSEPARTAIGGETDLIEDMCGFPMRPDASERPDAIHAVLKAGATLLGASTGMISNPLFLKSLVKWMLSFDPTWKSLSDDDDPMYKDELLGCAPGGVKKTLAKAACQAVLQHKPLLEDVLLPKTLLSLLVDDTSLESFLTAFVSGSVETLLVVWTMESMADLKRFLNDPKAERPDFTASLGRELVVAGTYFVRVYVEQKCASQPGFTTAVIKYILSELDKRQDDCEQHEQYQLAMKALTMLLTSTESFDMKELVKVFSKEETIRLLLARKKDRLVADVLNRHPRTVQAVLQSLNAENSEMKRHIESDLFLALSKIEQGAEFLVGSGGFYLYLLLRRFVIRNDHTALLAVSHCVWDVVQRDKALAVLAKWMPIGLCEQMAHVDQFVATLKSTTPVETCRLIWNSECVEELHRFLEDEQGAMKSLSYSALSSERVVGGVYIRVFLKDPNQEFDRPELFLEKAIEAFLAECTLRLFKGGATQTMNANSPSGSTFDQLTVSNASQEDDPVLTPLVSAVVAVLVSRSHLCSHLAAWGNAGAFVKVLATAPVGGQEAAGVLRIMKAMCSDAKCLKAFADSSSRLNSDTEPASNANFVDSLIRVTERSLLESEDVGVVAMEILRQCLDCPDIEGARYIAHLLLEDDFRDALRLVQLLDASVIKTKHRIHTIECLRRLESRFGSPQLSQRLEQVCAAWSKLRVQRHDLFISDQEERASRVFLLKGPAEAQKTDDILLLTNSQLMQRRGDEEGDVHNGLFEEEERANPVVVNTLESVFGVIEEDEPPL